MMQKTGRCRRVEDSVVNYNFHSRRVYPLPTLASVECCSQSTSVLREHLCRRSSTV